jgi:outer membrane protein OmpA-like peptidoglycan-associated protein
MRTLYEESTKSVLARGAEGHGSARPVSLRSSLTALGVAALLAGCAGPEGPNPDIERARSEVNRTAAMPVVAKHAPLELKRASDTVEQADREWREDGDSDEARHDAYVAAQNAAIAQNYALARDAEEQIKLANSTADKQRLDARTREAALARQEASTQAQRAAAADARVQELESRLRSIEAQQTERGLLVTLGDVLFETGKAELLAPAFPKLDRLAEFLRQYPDRRLLVEGYTDSVGEESYNLQLSQRRAESVRLALAQRGIGPDRITTRGYGESYPVANNATSEGRALNRRVEVVITDDRGTLRPRG